MKRAAFIIAALMVSAGVVFYLWGDRFYPSNNSALKNETPKPSPPLVTVSEVKRTDIPLKLKTIGHVEAMAFVAVKPRIEGTITEVSVKDGQDVVAGDPLFRLDRREQEAQLLTAKAHLLRDQAQLDDYRRDVERLSPLLQKNFATRQQMDQARAKIEIQEAIIEAGKADIVQQEVMLSYTEIRAPISGRLGTLRLKLGNVVRPGDAEPLVTINQLQPIYVSFPATQDNFLTLQQMMKQSPIEVEATLPGKISGEKGEIAYVENSADPATNTIEIKAVFANTGEMLWPGQFVNVTAVLRIDRDVLTAPLAALQNNQDGAFVWVVDANSTVSIRRITVTRIEDEWVIVGDGLKAGEKVVTEGHLRLKPEMLVEIATPVTVNTARP